MTPAEKIRQQILTHFKDLEFDEASHTYSLHGEQLGASVSSFVSEFYAAFDEDKHSARVAKKQGISQEKVLQRWKAKSVWSTDMGTAVHKLIEDMLDGKAAYHLPPMWDILGSVARKIAHYLIKSDRYEVIGQELRMCSRRKTGDSSYLMPGTLDLLVYDNKQQKIKIWDWKTNEEISQTNDFKQKMLAPFDAYPECELAKYSIQLCTYKVFLMQEFGFTSDSIDCEVKHITRDGLRTYACYDFTAIIQDLLNDRRPRTAAPKHRTSIRI